MVNNTRKSYKSRGDFKKNLLVKIFVEKRLSVYFPGKWNLFVYLLTPKILMTYIFPRFTN